MFRYCTRDDGIMSVTLEDMQNVSFQIIAQVGSAKSCYVEAMRCARENDFKKARELISEGDKLYSEAHGFHHDLVQKEASGIQLPFSMMIIHAEDQLLNTETIKIMAEEIILLREQMA